MMVFIWMSALNPGIKHWRLRLCPLLCYCKWTSMLVLYHHGVAGIKTQTQTCDMWTTLHCLASLSIGSGDQHHSICLVFSRSSWGMPGIPFVSGYPVGLIWQFSKQVPQGELLALLSYFFPDALTAGKLQGNINVCLSYSDEGIHGE